MPRLGRRLVVLALTSLGAALIVASPGASHADIEEQRARLPPPATCDDAVEGVWLSHSWSDAFGGWYMFTLRVRRAAPGRPELVGDIQSHAWYGTRAEAEPPPCRGGLDHWVVYMPARGRLDPDGTIHFGGTSWRTQQVLCGGPPGSYNTDQFSGKIDSTLQEFQSVNNDGGEAVNEPTVFRRVACLEPPAAPHVVVAPPPFFPSAHRGCGAR